MYSYNSSPIEQVKDSTGEDVREGVRVTSRNVEDLKDSKGQCNFQLKFVKDARRAAYLNVVPVKGVTRGLKAEDDRKWVPIIGFECRGMDVIGFHPEVHFHPDTQQLSGLLPIMKAKSQLICELLMVNLASMTNKYVELLAIRI